MSAEPSLNKKTFFATLWTVGSRFAVRFIGLISLVILAKILGPEDYGLVGKAAVIYGFLAMLSELGLEAALITNQKATPDHYSTAWTIHVLRGIIIAVILAVVAQPASVIMNEERLELIIYCYAGISFFDGFYNIGVVDFRKNMTFSKDFYFSLYQKLTSFVVTVAVAYIWQTYWALVIGLAAGQIAQIISSFWMSPMRPRLTLREFNSLFDFSKWMLVNEVVNAISIKVDAFLISVYSTTANVGLYNMSSEISSVPSTEIAMPVARACTPSFSKIRDDFQEFAKMYVDTLSIVLVIVIPAATGMAMLAEPIVLVALDDKWLDAVPIIQVLSIYGLIGSAMPTFISAMLASNRPDILTKLSILSVFYTVGILLFAILQFGFMGLIWGVVISSVIRVAIAQSIARNMKILSVRRLFLNLWRAGIANCAMIYGLFYLSGFDSPMFEGWLLIELILKIVAGAVIYGATIALLWRLSSKVDGPEKSILSVISRGKWGNDPVH